MRKSTQSRRHPGATPQLEFEHLVNEYKFTEVLSDDQVEQIHEASLEILESVGVEFLLPEALDLLASAGAAVEHETCRVRFDRDLITERLGMAPSQFTVHARNPAHDMRLGGRHVSFATVASAPNASDRRSGRRPGNFADFERFLKLAQMTNVVHAIGGYPVEPIDVPPRIRHLDGVRSMIALTDKPYRLYALGRGRIEDGLEMTRIAYGISAEALMEAPRVFTNVNVNSPLRIDGPMLAGLIEMARWNQAIIITPFTLCGAMAPVTLAGGLAQQNAEALAAIAFAQIVRPGAAVVYGGFTSNVDMKSGSPAFGTPENVKAILAGGQLARRYRLPYRSSNTNSSNAVDAQSAYESMLSLWAAVMGGGNFVQHAAGWLEGGLTASFEKMVVDAELLQNMAQILKPIQVDAHALALDAIRDVGPGGHFFGTPHTLERYRTAFYAPLLSDWSNYGRWTEKGSMTAEQRASSIFEALLAEYQAPPIDKGILDELDEFVAKRRAEGGVPD